MMVAGTQSAADLAVASFREHFKSAAVNRQTDGSWTVLIPDFPLPPGWSKAMTQIAFIVPAGFPVFRPDCFWADSDLRLATGVQPTNSGNSAPFMNMLWFSYHPQRWDVRDTVGTYVHLIKTRLEQLK